MSKEPPSIEIVAVTTERIAAIKARHAEDHTGNSSLDPTANRIHCTVCDLVAELADMTMQRDVMCEKLNEYIDKTKAAELGERKAIATAAVLETSEAMRQDAVLRLEMCAEMHQKAEQSCASLQRELEAAKDEIRALAEALTDLTESVGANLDKVPEQVHDAWSPADHLLALRRQPPAEREGA